MAHRLRKRQYLSRFIIAKMITINTIFQQYTIKKIKKACSMLQCKANIRNWFMSIILAVQCAAFNM